MTVPSGNIAAHLPAMAAPGRNRWPSSQPLGRDRHGRIRYRHLHLPRTRRRERPPSPPASNRSASAAVSRTVLMVPPSLDFFALTFALFKVGAVVVLIDPGMGMKTSASACAKRNRKRSSASRSSPGPIVLGWGRRTIRHCVTVGPRLGWGGCTLEHVRELGGNRPFSPRRTGGRTRRPPSCSPAAAPASPRASSTRMAFSPPRWTCCGRLYGIEPGEIDLPTFPLFGLFGPALGMTCVIPEMDPTRPARVDARKILDAIRRLRRHEPVRLAGPDPARRPLRRCCTAPSCRRCGA